MYGKLKADVREIIKRLCDYRNIEIIEGAVCADHVHLCLSIPPSEKVSDVIAYIKGKSALMIHDKYPEMVNGWSKSFWARGYYVATVGNITEEAVKEYIQQQKEELAEANRYIEKSTAQKLQFFTNITHEIKTPLTLILGPLGKLSKEAPEGSSLADDIRNIRKNAERLKRVVDQLLDFRKVESNKMNMRVGEVDLVAFVAEVKSCFDTMAAAKQIHFTFEHDCPSVSLWVYRVKMELMQANL